MAPAPNLYSLPLPYPFPQSVPQCVFIVNAQNRIKHTKYFFLPGVVDRDGVETVLFWPLILSHAIFLLKHSRTQSCVSFCIFAPSSMNHQWSTSRGKNLFLFFHTFDGEGGGGCNKNSPLHRWELLSQFYSFFVNGK